jgi:hypothetical protein
MNDNLPEINFKEKKEKKRGALGWLRNKLGFGTRGAIEEAGINPSAMNVGRALGGGARFGASSGLAGLLAGKAGLIATMALIAVAGGMYMVRNSPNPTAPSAAFSSNKVPDNYVPAILRSEAANQGSSLDMFKETNKGAVSMDENAPAKPAEPKPAAADEAKAQDANQPAAPDQSNMAQSMMGKLQGASMGSLTSSLGGESNNFSGMGGFGNKFNQGALGAKSGFTAGIGAGFQNMPKFDQRKNKMLAMKAPSKALFSKAKSANGAKVGKGAYNQAKGLHGIQTSYTGANIDSARSTQDKAWSGTTGDGSTDATGAGVSNGGAGIVTSPSLDNGSGSTGGGSVGSEGNASVPDTSNPASVSPWASLISRIMMLLMISCILIGVAALVAKIPVYGKMIAMILAAIAAALALAAIVMAIQLMSTYGQTMLGMLYMIGGGLVMAGAIMAISGMDKFAKGTLLTPLWLAAGAGIVGLMGSMFSSK